MRRKVVASCVLVPPLTFFVSCWLAWFSDLALVAAGHQLILSLLHFRILVGDLLGNFRLQNAFPYCCHLKSFMVQPEQPDMFDVTSQRRSWPSVMLSHTVNRFSFNGIYQTCLLDLGSGGTYLIFSKPFPLVPICTDVSLLSKLKADHLTCMLIILWLPIMLPRALHITISQF